MRASITHIDYERLSAYLDGQLSSREQLKMEDSLRTRPDLISALEELRQTRELIRLSPKKIAPRNFTLTPAMLEQAGGNKQYRFQKLFPTFSFASAIASIGLVIALFFDLFPGVHISPTASMDESQEVALEAPAPSRDFVPEMSGAEILEEKTVMEEDAIEEDIESETAIVEMAPEEMTGKFAVGGTGGGAPMSEIHPDYGSISGVYAQPPQAFGRGGDGIDYIDKGYGGGPIIIPFNGIELGVNTADASELNNHRVENSYTSPIESEGPILGIPSDEVKGEIIIRSGWGLSVEKSEVRSSGDLDSQRQFEFPSISLLRVLEIILAGLAVAFAATAWIVRRR